MAIENLRCKYIFLLVEFKRKEFFTFYGGYLLNTKL